MLYRRQISAVVLLTTFIVGSLIAPFSHYIFMVFSDAYAPLQTTAMHEGSHHAPSYTDDGIVIHTSNHHLICDYADLFATFAATAFSTSQVAKTPLQLRIYQLERERPPYVISFNNSRSRAPPLA